MIDSPVSVDHNGRMLDFLCRTYWDNHFVHYFLFGILGPCIGLLAVVIFRKNLKARYWLKALSIFLLVNLSSCAVSWKANTGCQLHLFGEVGDDPGDVGVVLVTIPIFLICFAVALGLLFYVRKFTKPAALKNP